MAINMTRCGFCRRAMDQGSRSLEESPLRVELLQIKETYCPDCERFYQQLVTFGRGLAPSPMKHMPDTQTHEIPQTTITMRISP